MSAGGLTAPSVIFYVQNGDYRVRIMYKADLRDISGQSW